MLCLCGFELYSRWVPLPIGTRLSLRQSSFWWPFYFKSFQNAKISHYTPRNDNEIEVSAY